jgi:hypothetical protein
MPSASAKRRFDYLPLTIRLETAGGVATPLVLRGTPLPTVRSERFSTAADRQVSVSVELSIGESSMMRNNVSVGKFLLEGLPPKKKGEPQITVTFSVDNYCVITAEARLDGSELRAKQQFEIPFDLSEKRIAEAIASAETIREADERETLRVEATNRAKNILAQAEEKLIAGPNVQLSEAVAELGLALASDDSEQIRLKTDTLQSLLVTPGFDLLSDPDLFRNIFSVPRPPKSNPLRQSRPKASKETLTTNVPPHQLGKLFGGANFTLDPQLCFVLMPFAEKYRPLYEDHIRPSVTNAGLLCERADEIRGMNLITWDIWERINRARFLIADLTEQNPNVFYELGLAHAISKDVILITQSEGFVPFDLKAIRWIKYDFTPRGTQKLEKDLKATVNALMKLS